MQVSNLAYDDHCARASLRIFSSNSTATGFELQIFCFMLPISKSHVFRLKQHAGHKTLSVSTDVFVVRAAANAGT